MGLMIMLVARQVLVTSMPLLPLIVIVLRPPLGGLRVVLLLFPWLFMLIMVVTIISLMRAPQALTRRIPQHILPAGISNFFLLIIMTRLVTMVIAWLLLAAGPQRLDELVSRARCLPLVGVVSVLRLLPPRLAIVRSIRAPRVIAQIKVMAVMRMIVP